MAAPRQVEAFVKIIDSRQFDAGMFTMNFFQYTDPVDQQVLMDILIEAIHLAPHLLRNCKNPDQRRNYELLIKMGQALDLA